MSNPIEQNMKILVDSNNSLTNNKHNENTIISIEKSKENENCQHTLIENNKLSKYLDSDINGEQYTSSSLLSKDLYPQVLASCISLLVQIQSGVNLAYSNNLLHYTPSLNKEELSWITSILALCIPIGAFVIGLVVDRIGRKYGCLLTCIPFLASWLISAIIRSDGIFMFLTSRILAGIGSGMSIVSLVYVSEIAHPSYKQLLLSLMSVYFSGGILISTLTTRLDSAIVNLLFIGFSVITMILIIFYVPESPIWLLQFKRSESRIHKAKNAMKQIYPNNDQVFSAEWNRVVMMSTSDANRASTDDNQRSFIESLRSSPAAYKPMTILLVLLLLVQLSGAYPTISYALPIFNSLTNKNDEQSINAIESLTMLGVVRFGSGLLTTVLSFYVGRKPLLIISCFGMIMASVLVVFTVNTTGSPNVLWALCGIMVFVFSSSLGVIVFPWTMIYELLPTSIKAVGGCLLVSYSYVIMFIVMKIFPFILGSTSVSNVFMIFGTVSLVIAIYVYFVLPETLRKSFKEIEDHFTQPKNK